MFTINWITFEQASLNPTLANKHSFINAFVWIDEWAAEWDKVVFLFSKSANNQVLYNDFWKWVMY